MKLSEFDYQLPNELIAQHPLQERDKCRLLVLDRASRRIEHKTFDSVAEYMMPGDCLVMNNTRVISARLFGRRKSGGKVEIFVLEKKDPVCEALVRPSGRLKEGERITLESGDTAELLGRGEVGRMVRFSRKLDDILEEAGHIPLPPYIGRMDRESDRDDYQTVYGTVEGATASPTAGLHFTAQLMERVKGQGSRVKFVTLHTSYGTFAPVKSEDVAAHRMHKECFELPAETIEAIRETKKRGGKVFAVGTTTARVLEHCASQITHCSLRITDYGGYTGLFIYPGYEFKVVDHLITNFHLPKSTLLLLVSAFAGKESIFEAYRQAIEAKYRFFSYGDAMLIL
ncbi:MAG: tRNA preQ1(34) S-adenosylmethionine ribosyltransferase-isomerase QueA [Candidatus Omnitrophica bacterium]|nr:tRNA preQ1(34) S-adenosylmethionine ribosyltransferase-isomerase QueA [Candidatus Omnitrophota bacterium]